MRKREDLFNHLEEEFMTHASFEEKFFYPIVKNDATAKDIVLEAYEEHQEVKLTLKELNKLETSDEKWLPRLKVIKENIEHHVKEEESELFPLNLSTEPTACCSHTRMYTAPWCSKTNEY